MEPEQILHIGTVVLTGLMIIFLVISANFANVNFWAYNNSYAANCPLINPNNT